MTTTDPDARAALVADMCAYAASIPQRIEDDPHMHGSASGSVIVPPNVTDAEYSQIRDSIPEGARVSVYRDRHAALYSNGRRYEWGTDDGGLHRWRDAVSFGQGTVLTLDISMHDVLDAWRGKYVITNEDGDGHFEQAPRTIEEAIVIAAANQLASGLTGDYVKGLVGAEVAGIIREHTSTRVREFTEAALAEPIQKTDQLGRPMGDPVSVFEVATAEIQKLVTDRRYDEKGNLPRSGYSTDAKLTMVEAIVARTVTGHLTKELTEAVDAAKAQAVDAVKDEATNVVSTVLAERFAAIGQG